MRSWCPSRLAWLLSIIGILGRNNLSAQSPEITAQTSSHTAAPGQIIHLVISTQHLRPGGSFEDDAILPQGWSAIETESSKFDASANGTARRFLSFRISRTATKGFHHLIYRIVDLENALESARMSIDVIVSGVARIDAQIVQKPESAIAGETSVLVIDVANMGNFAVVVELLPKSSPAVTLNLSTNFFALQAGETRTVTAGVQTDSQSKREFSQYAEIRGQAIAPGSTNLFASPGIVFDVFPREDKGFDPYQRLPSQLTTAVAYETHHEVSIASEISGKGYLDQDLHHHVDYLLRSPESGGKDGAIGRREEYGITYESQAWRVRGGDRAMSLSPLTMPPRISRGVEVEWHPATEQAGILFTQGQGPFDPRNEAGGYVRHNLSEDLFVQGSAIRIDTGTNIHPHQLYSLWGSWQVTNWFTANLEAAGDPESHTPAAGFAWRAQGAGYVGDATSISAELLHGGRDFAGAYSDLQTINAGFSYKMNPNFRVHASRVDQVNNLESDPTRSKLGRTETRAGSTYNPDPSSTFMLEGFTKRNEEIAPGAKDVSADFYGVRLGGNRATHHWSFGTLQEVGIITYIPTHPDTSFVERSTATIGWHPTEFQSYSVAAGYGTSFEGTDPGRSFFSELSGSWWLNKQTSLSISAGRRQAATGSTERDSVSTRLEWRSNNNQSVAVGTRVSKDQGQEGVDLSVLVVYSVPFGMPVGMKHGLGRLEGVVTDGDFPTHLPISKAVVHLNTGDRKITDNMGHYLFEGLPPGEYSVSVDFRSIGFGRTYAELVPEVVTIAKDAATRLNLTIVSVSSLTVQITVLEDIPRPQSALSGVSKPENPEYRSVGGLAGEVVEISNGNEVYRRVTGPKGEASFTGLRPGQWLLTAYQNAVPLRHSIENPERRIRLLPGEKGIQVLRVLPKRRAIQMIELTE